jgi:PAP2 superfamily
MMPKPHLHRRPPVRVVLAVASLVMSVTIGTSAHAGEVESRHDSARPVLDWSAIAQNSIVAVAKKFPGEAALLMGIVHVAIYDATAAVEGGLEPYADHGYAPSDASLPAAVATAAHGVLVTLFPSQQNGSDGLDATYTAYLATIEDGTTKTDGIATGAHVARTINALRADDGRATVVPYVQQPPGPGVYEPTAPVVLGTTLAQVRPLVLDSSSQFRPNGPPRLTSGRYARDLAEVQEFGRVDSSRRSTEQTATALFWTDNDVAQWNRGLHKYATASGLDAAGVARLLALAHVAGGDAMIACFDAKYTYNFWRPVHAIPRADSDENPRTEADPGWISLRPTPPFPEYPSAHACHSGAIATILKSVVGHDDVDFELDSAVTGQTRTYRHFNDIVNEVNNARIWAGFHYRASTDDGAKMGRRIASHILHHTFQTHRSRHVRALARRAD